MATMSAALRIVAFALAWSGASARAVPTRAAPSSTSIVNGASSRRALLLRSGTIALSAGHVSQASAAQKGAEDAYAVQSFGNTACTRRTPLGACVEAAPDTASVAAPSMTTRSFLPKEPEPESELVTRLLKRSADNAEKNAREVEEKTIKAALPGTYGPFSSTAPVMRADGSFDVVTIRRLERLKGKGKIVQTKTGLDAYIEGFDPDAPEPKEKFLGIF